MLINIYFDNEINSSISIGDYAYYCAVSADGVAMEEPQFIGEITDIFPTYIAVNNVSSSFAPGSYIFFSKPIQTEESSLKGYYANITLENASRKYAELFAISSETVISSK